VTRHRGNGSLALTALGSTLQVFLRVIPSDDTLVTLTGGVGAAAVSVAPALGFAPALGSPAASWDLRGAAGPPTTIAATREGA